MSSHSRPKFSDGEKVLCFHGPLLYEAKCIKSQIKDKHLKYFIHYSGWNKNWDEWVPESRVLKFNESNLQKRKELEKTHVKTKKSKATKAVGKKESVEKERASSTPHEKHGKQRAHPAPTPSTSESLADGKRKKLKAEPTFEPEEEYVPKMERKVDLPEELKLWLVDDWDFISRQRKLLHLPARVTVEHILGEYVKHKIGQRKITVARGTSISEVANGIREYFNVMLGKQLLYKFERPQYQDILLEYPDRPMSELYGAVHLLRLFAKLGTVMAHANLTEDNLRFLLNHFQDFVEFIARSSQRFLALSDYEVASPEYHRKAL